MNKIEHAKKLVEKHGFDAWIVFSNEQNDPHSQILLNTNIILRHYIIITPDNVSVIIHEGELGTLEKSFKNLGVDANIIPFRSNEDISNQLENILQNKKIALDFGENILTNSSTQYAEYLPLGEFRMLEQKSKNCELLSAAPLVFDLRSVKSQLEIKQLRDNITIHLEILEDLPTWAKIGMTENEIKRILESKFYEIGGIPSFSTIVANNANAADIHHGGSNLKITRGPLIIDSGIKLNDMCTDITWTYWVGSNPTDIFLKTYQDLQNIKEACLKVIKPGISTNLPAKKCRELMAELGYDHEKLYNHSLGHALGFHAHDVGYGMSSITDSKYKFVEGNIYTLEPGFYWKGDWGIRLEDNFVLTNNGTELISKCPDEPLIIN